MDLRLGTLIAALLIGTLGLSLFVFGRKQQRFPQMAAGALLMVYPYFIENVWLTFGIAVVVLVAMLAALRAGW